MKKALAILAQFFLFLFVDAVGSIFYHPFRIQTKLSGTSLIPRSFVWDGLIFMLLVYLLILIIQLLRKRLPRSILGTTVALVLAALAGYFLKFGFVTYNW